MDKRTVMKMALEWERPPYVPWNINFTIPSTEKLQQYYAGKDLEEVVQNHIVNVGYDIYFYHEVGENSVQDHFGVIWDRSIDKDIGVVKGQVLAQPTLSGYTFPDPVAAYVFEQVEANINKYKDRFRIFGIGFSLYERAWALRGLQTLLMDFYDNPEFVHALLNAISDYNIDQIKEALKYDIDGIMFGDDWGQQHGLQMGPKLWYEFIYPVLKRMYQVVTDAGKKVFIHSCGDVDELFDDLIGIGLNCFNPFQPEVMDVASLITKYHGHLAFYGGMSTQITLPYGTVDDVRRETQWLLELGSAGGYIFSPAHDVPKDVPLENMLAMIDLVQRQDEYLASS
jgi:uroporphyrinogen decarboxylase